MKRWRAVAGAALIVLLLAGAWLYYYRSEAVYERIVNRDGYSVSLIKEQVSTEFYLKPEWIPERDGEENELNLVLEEKFGTRIILERVGKREDDFFIQLDAVPNPNVGSGQLLLTDYINADGSFSSGDFGNWVVTDSEGKDILGGSYGAGSGPSNQSAIFIDDSYRERFEQGAYVRFSGYNLYGYRQLTGTPWVTWLFSLAAAGLWLYLIVLYRRRGEQERTLGWKLVGYMLLGAFTFSINAVKLPLGFAFYMLFFRKAKPNDAIKRKAALLGLLVYALQVLQPSLAGAVNRMNDEMTVRDVSIEEIGPGGLWKSVVAQAAVSEQARLSEYEAILSEQGELKELSFTIVDRGQDGYVHTDAEYNAQDQSLVLKRITTDEWIQYDRQMMSDYFFKQVADLHNVISHQGGEYPYIKLKLMSDGTLVNYGIKDRDKFRVSLTDVIKIDDDELPIEGYWVSGCGTGEGSGDYSECKNPTDYLLGAGE